MSEDIILYSLFWKLNTLDKNTMLRAKLLQSISNQEVQNTMDAYKIIETARKTGKIEKGTNEVTKAIERGTAKFVVYAGDVNPKEIVQHIPLLCKDKKIPCEEVDSKQKLGIAAGLPVSASSIAVIELGEAKIPAVK